MDPAAVDAAIALLARHQYGVFTRLQATARGATRSLIAGRLATGRWLAIEPGLYALPGTPFTWERKCMAAALAAPGSAVSGPAAAALHGVPMFGRGAIEITVPLSTRPRTTLARVRRSSDFEATTIDRIPVLTVADTTISVARRVSARRLGSIVDSIAAADSGFLAALQDRFVVLGSGRPAGAAALRSVLAERGDGYVPPASLLEATLLDLLARSGHDVVAIRQAPLPWRPGSKARVDVFVPVWRAILEADGRRWHTRVDDFESDRERDNEAVLHGYRPVRFTWHQLTQRPGQVMAVFDRLAKLAAAGSMARSARVA